MLYAEIVQMIESFVEESPIVSHSRQHMLIVRVHLRIEQVKEAVLDDTKEELSSALGLPEDHRAKEVRNESHCGDVSHNDWL